MFKKSIIWKIRQSRRLKERYRKLLEEYEKTGKLPRRATFLRDPEIQEVIKKDC
jgi:hypothetical protein